MSTRTIFGALLAVTLLPTWAQTPAPAQPAEQTAKPHPPLKLRLDEVEPRPLITFTPKEAEKKRDGASLPSLGGNPSPALERTPSQVVPKDQTPGL